jgi:VIT1/CCC1 family predicted Fe2+/Mn2+ transporter
MAASNYLGTKAEADEREKIGAHELQQLRNFPFGEEEELREIFHAKGFAGEELERVVRVIADDESEWLKVMLQEEYGLGLSHRRPLLSGLATFAAFVIFGTVPLLPYLAGIPSPFLAAGILARICFFLVGSLKSLWALEAF